MAIFLVMNGADEKLITKESYNFKELSTQQNFKEFIPSFTIGITTQKKKKARN